MGLPFRVLAETTRLRRPARGAPAESDGAPLEDRIHRRMHQRYSESVESVRAFLAQFYGSDIILTEDEENECVLFTVDHAKKTIVVEGDFLADFGPREIRENLAAWNVAHLSRTLERGCRLIITSLGTEEERA